MSSYSVSIVSNHRGDGDNKLKIQNQLIQSGGRGRGAEREGVDPCHQSRERTLSKVMVKLTGVKKWMEMCDVFE